MVERRFSNIEPDKRDKYSQKMRMTAVAAMVLASVAVPLGWLNQELAPLCRHIHQSEIQKLDAQFYASAFFISCDSLAAKSAVLIGPLWVMTVVHQFMSIGHARK